MDVKFPFSSFPPPPPPKSENHWKHWTLLNYLIITNYFLIKSEMGVKEFKWEKKFWKQVQSFIKVFYIDQLNRINY